MRHYLTLALAACFATATASSALAQSKTYDLDGFDILDISSGIDATVSLGETFAVEVDANSQDALDKLELRVDGTSLVARLDQSFLDFILSGGLIGGLLNDGPVIVMRITMPELVAVNASAGADVDVADPKGAALSVDVSSGANVEVTGAAIGAFKVNVSSGSDAALSGTCDSFDANASSGADIDARGLVCKTADANASSGADISLTASDSAAANASSGGDINVFGNPPATDFESSSGGDVRLAD